MQRKPIAMALAVAGTIGLAAAVPGFAADTGGSTNSKTGANAAAQAGMPSQAGTSATGTSGSMSNSMSTGTPGSMSTGSTMRAGAAGGQSFDKTGAGDSWATDYATKNNGRISRKAYMDEMGRRWDAMDRNQQGLTPAEVSRIYGNVDSAAGPARTGSGVQGGNMGPGNQKGQ